jgi:hypothetical protein
MVLKEHKHKQNTGQVTWVRTGVPETYQKVYEKVEEEVAKTKNSANNVQVAIRTRPLSNKDHFLGTQRAVETTRGKNTINVSKRADGDHTSVVGNSPHETKEFPFDIIFSEHHGQEDVFQQIVIDLLVNSWIGYNLCVFAYGQTGSGKSYTMQGAGSDVGIIPRFCEMLFATIALKEAEVEKLNVVKGRVLEFDWKVHVQYVQIYNEQIQDLLDEETGGRSRAREGGLKIREHAIEGTYVEGAGKKRARNFDDIAHLMEKAVGRRAMASHELNNSSSRSHCVMIIYFSQRLVERSEDSHGAYNQQSNQELEVYNKFPHINLVDLAGSEDNRRTLTSGQTLQEGCNINRSLTTLGRCITALAENCSHSGSHSRNGSDSSFNFEGEGINRPRRNSMSSATAQRRKSMSMSGHSPSSRNGTPHPNHTTKHVPFRDSTLTRLLKGSLDGNSKTVMLATISPATTDVDETLGTLRYASLCKKIVTRAVAIETRAENPQLVQMASEMMDLRRQMASAAAMDKQLELSREETMRAQAERTQMQANLQRHLEEAREVEAALNSLAAEHAALGRESAEERETLLGQLQDAGQNLASTRVEREEEQRQMQQQLENKAQELEQVLETTGATKGEVRGLHATIDDLQMERMEMTRAVETLQQELRSAQQAHKRTEQEATAAVRRVEQQLEEARGDMEQEFQMAKQQEQKHVEERARWTRGADRQEQEAERLQLEIERTAEAAVEEHGALKKRLQRTQEQAMSAQREELTREHQLAVKDQERTLRKQFVTGVSDALAALEDDIEYRLKQRLRTCGEVVNKWENAQAEIVAVETKAAKAATPDQARRLLSNQRKRSSRILLDDADRETLEVAADENKDSLQQGSKVCAHYVPSFFVYDGHFIL